MDILVISPHIFSHKTNESGQKKCKIKLMIKREVYFFSDKKEV
jgi:hypothetical protein